MSDVDYVNLLLSCIAVSPDEVWLLPVSKLGSSLPAAESGSHCRPGGVKLAGRKRRTLTERQK